MHWLHHTWVTSSMTNHCIPRITFCFFISNCKKLSSIVAVVNSRQSAMQRPCPTLPHHFPLLCHMLRYPWPLEGKAVANEVISGTQIYPHGQLLSLPPPPSPPSLFALREAPWAVTKTAGSTDSLGPSYLIVALLSCSITPPQSSFFKYLL